MRSQQTAARMARRTGLALAVAAMAAVALPAASFKPVAAAEIEEITWALPHLPKTLLVPHEWSTNMGGVMSLVQEGLLAFDDNLALAPAVANSWEQVDPTTYVYHLRDGVTFHDGSPVTADDVVYSMNWHLDLQNRSQLTPFYSAVESIEATGDREITVKLKNPDAQFQYTVAHMSGFIMKRSQLEAAGEDYGTPDVLPLGTGPYKVVEYVPDDHVVLEAYEDYWGGPPPVDRITIVSIADQQTRLLAMRNGDIDGTFDVSISDIDQWQGLDGVDVITAPSLGVYLLTLDQESPPFDDVEVRRAIAHAVDREGLVKALLKGNGEAGGGDQPARHVGGRAERGRGARLLCDPGRSRLRPRGGEGGPGRLLGRGRLRDHGAGAQLRSLHGPDPAHPGPEPEGVRHHAQCPGGRQRPVAGRLLRPRGPGDAGHVLLSRLRRPGQLPVPVLRQLAMRSRTA